MQIDARYIEIVFPYTKPVSIKIDAIEAISVIQIYGRNFPSLEIKGSGGTVLFSYEGADSQLYYNKLMLLMEPYRFKPDTIPLPAPPKA
jgi:hypothetical protein